jgi:hypothetical protein
MGETLYRIITIRSYFNKITVIHLFIRLKLHIHRRAVRIPVYVVGMGWLYPANPQLLAVKKKISKRCEAAKLNNPAEKNVFPTLNIVRKFLCPSLI